MKKFFNPKAWTLLLVVVCYIITANLFFEYIINREVPGFIQVISSITMGFCGILVIYQVVSFLVNSINFKKKKKR
jgi:hypothetical protein